MLIKRRFNLQSWLLDRTQDVETRNGRPVRIICHDRENPHTKSPIVALVGEEQDIVCYNEDGTTGSSIPMPSDLFLYSEPGQSNIEMCLEQFHKDMLDLGKADIGTETLVRNYAVMILTMARTQTQFER